VIRTTWARQKIPKPTAQSKVADTQHLLTRLRAVILIPRRQLAGSIWSPLNPLVSTMGFPIPDSTRLSSLPIFTVSCLLVPHTRESLVCASPLQLATAMASFHVAGLGIAPDADFHEALCFAAQHGGITGRLAMEGDVETLVAQLLSSFRRTRAGTVPFGAAFRVRRFLEHIRDL